MFEQEDKKISPSAPPAPPLPPKPPVPAPGKPQGGGEVVFQKGAKAPAISLPEIHVMPEKLIGAPAGRAPVVREVVVTREQKVQAPAPLPPRPAPKKRGNLFLIIALVVVLLGVGVSVVILYVPFGKKVQVANLNENVPPPANENANVPPPANENANANANENANVNVPPPQPPRSGPDSDSDGLTDVEETTIYMSDPKNPDTDGDSFNDGNEVVHLFDPTIKSPALLKDSPHIRPVTNAAESYSVLTPATWTERGAGTDQYFIDAPSGEFIEILVTDKPADQTLMDWYLATSPDAKASDVTGSKTYKGLDSLRSSDRLTAYVDAGSKVITITYNPNGMTDYNFISTEEMVIASLELIKP